MVIKTHHILCDLCLPYFSLLNELTWTEAFPSHCSPGGKPTGRQCSGDSDGRGFDATRLGWRRMLDTGPGERGMGNGYLLFRPPTSVILSALLADCKLPERNKTLFCSSLHPQGLPQSKCLETLAELMGQLRVRRGRERRQQRTVLR